MSNELELESIHTDDDEEEATESDVEAPIRGQNVFLRHESEMGPMCTRARFMTRMKSPFRRILSQGKKEARRDDDGGVIDVEERKKQYRLEATTRRKKTFCQKVCCCCRRAQKLEGVAGISPNQRLVRYLHWLFRINFFFLFTLSCVMFFSLTFFFAGLIVLAGNIDPNCVRIGGEAFDPNGNPFADAFALSWTTFSTVGYGSTYPALTPENDNPTNCLFITAICSLESFIGVLYSGFCGAILFGKVLRIQSHAQVIFSDPLVIRYGSGVEENEERVTEENAKAIGEVDEKKRIPCPVLEFRIINRLFGEAGGEIMDATLNVVASVDANDVDPSVRDSIDSERQRFLRNNRGSFAPTADGSSDGGSDAEQSASLHSFTLGRMVSILHSTKRDHQTVEEDPSSRLVGKRVFSKMLIEANDHPFFKRVWLARHVLDEHSPLVSLRTRRAIRKNGGFWPEHLNSYEGVKESLQFHQILVSLNGVSNVSASDVYAQKIYDAADANVGYQFVNLLYRDVDGTLKVDVDLINDVREQNGGGGEPLFLGI